jgi:hypothetical protein
MQARQQRREVEPVWALDEDLPVDGQISLLERAHGVHELGEVARERTSVTADEDDVVAFARGETAEAVPLRLVQVVARRDARTARG